VRLPLDPAEISAINLVPPELGAYLTGTVTRLPALIA